MCIVDIVVFLVVMTIPAAGGWFLYAELKWGKYRDKSVGYGCLWALSVFILLLANNQIRFIGKLVDAAQYRNCYTLQYVAPANASGQVLQLDVDMLKSKNAEILNAKSEKLMLSSYVWNVINYKANGKMTDKSYALQKVLFAKDIPILKAR